MDLPMDRIALCPRGDEDVEHRYGTAKKFFS